MNSDYPLRTYVRRFFTERLPLEVHATPSTVANYRHALFLFFRFVADHIKRDPTELEVEDIDANLVKEFRASCKERGNSASSNNTRLTAIRSLFRYIGECEPKLYEHCKKIWVISNQNITDEESNEQGKRKDRPYLTEEEVKALMNAPDSSSRLGRRDRALLLLMLKTGLRTSEVIALRLRDIELGANPYVRCNADGPKERRTPLFSETLVALRSWISERRARRDDPLFLSTHRKALSHDAVQRLVHKHAKKAIEECASLGQKRVTPHVLRYTAARQFQKDGVDRGQIARWLGYKSAARNEVNVDGEIEPTVKGKDQTRPDGSGHDQSEREYELLEFLKSYDRAAR